MANKLPESLTITAEQAADPVVLWNLVLDHAGHRAAIHTKHGIAALDVPEGRTINRYILAPERNRIEGMGEPSYLWRLRAVLDDGREIGDTPWEG